MRLQFGFRNGEVVFSEGQSGGVALFWQDGLDIRFLSKSKSHVDVEIQAVDGLGVRWRMIGLYGNPLASERHLTWDLLRDLYDVSTIPWVVIRDFNEIVQDNEKDGGVPQNLNQMMRFQSALDDTELLDLGFQGAPYTWKGGNVRCQLDRAVASPSWLDLFPASFVTHLPPIHGDHVPLLLSVHNAFLPSKKFMKFRFRFESSWTAHEACKGVIESSWAVSIQGQPMFQVMKKIANTLMELNDWQRATFGNRKREIEGIQERLEQFLCLPLTANYLEEHSQLSNQLKNLLDEERNYWKQRSRVAWLNEGDKNTNYFHRKTSNHRAKNRLRGLFDVNGVWQASDKGWNMWLLDTSRPCLLLLLSIR
uniref:uncharacterized protein LOC105352889 n=1 Tax=Fragaria vesca subsp. vesca TaxID=101020 RepID=UPI0005CAE26C|nr:PREDICTED: uncharacterized protein LOC105352889 [Fragaria vesca subsp. vesca]